MKAGSAAEVLRYRTCPPQLILYDATASRGNSSPVVGNYGYIRLYGQHVCSSDIPSRRSYAIITASEAAKWTLVHRHRVSRAARGGSRPAVYRPEPLAPTADHPVPRLVPPPHRSMLPCAAFIHLVSARDGRCDIEREHGPARSFDHHGRRRVVIDDECVAGHRSVWPD